MMNWFYKWLGNKIYWANQNEDDEDMEAIPSAPHVISSGRRNKISKVRENESLDTSPITFKMFKASGGWAIEFRQYDHKTDRVDTNLYVVNGEEELGKHLSHIITMEALKR